MKYKLTFFIDRDSCLHRYNPLTKLMLVLTLIILAFVSNSYWLPTALILVIIIPLSFLGKVQKEFFQVISKLLLPVVGFLFIMQSFFYPGGKTAIFHIWVLKVTYEGVAFAYLTASRIFVMVSSFVLLLLSTHPSTLMNDLTRRGLSGTFAYVITSTLQIIPQMRSKAATIIDAQRSRGLDTEGSYRKRIGSLLPLVGPLVFGSLVEVEERAIAIEARAFTSKIKKTYLKEIRDTKTEKIVRWAFAFIILFVIGSRIWRL